MTTSSIRRIMTGFGSAGRSTLLPVETVPIEEFVAIPGFAVPVVASMSPGSDHAAASQDTKSLIPPPGGATFTFLSLAPASWSARADFDQAAANTEMAARLPQFATLFDADRPGMHATPTVDYGVVISGQAVLEMDDGSEIVLHPGDVFVQNATRHAWHNRGDVPALLALVMIGVQAQDDALEFSKTTGESL